MRLIDADALISEIKKAEKCYKNSKHLSSELCPYKFAFAEGVGTVADLIVQQAPTVEYDYCPWCGAKMDEENSNEADN